MINRVVLVGRLTKDPVLRHTGSNISVAQFTLAVDRQFKNSQGERGADFISCVIWRKNAENFVNFVKKGNLTGIDGRIQTRTYDDKDGKRVYVTEVVVDNFSLLEKKQDNDSNSNNSSASTTGSSNNSSANNDQSNSNVNSSGASNANDNITQSGTSNNASSGFSNSQNSDFGNDEDSIDISDDDLPF